MATKIMIDAGHGGYDNGASYEGRLEKNDNLNLALALGDEHQNGGCIRFSGPQSTEGK